MINEEDENLSPLEGRIKRDGGYDIIDKDPDYFVTTRRKPRNLTFRPDHFSLTEDELKECVEREDKLKRKNYAQFTTTPYGVQQPDLSFFNRSAPCFQTNFSSKIDPHQANFNNLSAPNPVSNNQFNDFSTINPNSNLNPNEFTTLDPNSNLNFNNFTTTSNRPNINPNIYFSSNYPNNSSQRNFIHPNSSQSNFAQTNYSQPNFSQPNFPQFNSFQYSHQNDSQPSVQRMPNINLNSNTTSNLQQPNQGLDATNLITSGNQNEIRRQFIRRLESIPKFDGNSCRELIDFIDIADTLFNSCMNELEENEFYEQMVLQLRGEAKQIVTGLNNTDWAAIKSKLHKKISYLANKDILTSQLENLRQEKDESLTKYAERARKLLQEKNSVYKT